jgi:hypothetical protein
MDARPQVVEDTRRLAQILLHRFGGRVPYARRGRHTRR